MIGFEVGAEIAAQLKNLRVLDRAFCPCTKLLAATVVYRHEPWLFVKGGRGYRNPELLHELERSLDIIRRHPQPSVVQTELEVQQMAVIAHVRENATREHRAHFAVRVSALRSLFGLPHYQPVECGGCRRGATVAVDEAARLAVRLDVAPSDL